MSLKLILMRRIIELRFNFAYIIFMERIEATTNFITWYSRLSDIEPEFLKEMKERYDPTSNNILLNDETKNAEKTQAKNRWPKVTCDEFKRATKVSYLLDIYYLLFSKEDNSYLLNCFLLFEANFLFSYFFKKLAENNYYKKAFMNDFNYLKDTNNFKKIISNKDNYCAEFCRELIKFCSYCFFTYIPQFKLFKKEDGQLCLINFNNLSVTKNEGSNLSPIVSFSECEPIELSDLFDLRKTSTQK